MSDFDKEAERERLREKYERDQQKREASERMSDLLLKGATMTNSHCGSCGDPIFRYDGEEFCPTCQQVVTSDDAADVEADERAADETAGEATADTDANGDSPAHIEIKEPDGPDVQTGGDQSADASTARTQASTPQTENQQPTDPSQSGQAQSGQSHGPRSEPAPNSTGSPPSQPGSDTARNPRGPTPSEQTTADADDGISVARATLVRTLRTQAERAEQCDDPRRARDHLAAAREAAETLSALSSSY